MATRTPLQSVSPPASQPGNPEEQLTSDRGAPERLEDSLRRQIVRTTSGKVLRSDDLIADEKEVAAAILRANPHFGNPHEVRCDWCHETRTLFRDENDGPFKLTPHGWRCEPCNTMAASQEIKF